MRKRVLVSAYYFSPYRGGEAAVGWKYASGLAKHHDVTVVFGDLSDEMPMRTDLERYAEEDARPQGLDWVHVAADSRAKFLHRLHCIPGCWFFYYSAYRHWQKLAYERVKSMHAERPFDIIHHLTIIGYREPGYLWQLNAPFVWGPINGAAALPWAYLRGFGLLGTYRHLTRNILNSIQMRLPSRSRKAASAARKIWTVTKEDQHMVERLWQAEAEIMIETGALPSQEAIIRTLVPEKTLQLVWCGLIEDRKALHLVIKALAQLSPNEDCELHVIGDGPERSRCESLAKKQGVDAMIHWHGRVSHEEAQRLMSQGHALVHSALKEGTPHVVLEAMAQAMPVICHDACGMGVAVTEESGIKIPMRNPRESIAGFLAAIRRLLEDPDLVERLSTGALQRAREQSWDGRIEAVSRSYDSILAE